MARLKRRLGVSWLWLAVVCWVPVASAQMNGAVPSSSMTQVAVVASPGGSTTSPIPLKPSTAATPIIGVQPSIANPYASPAATGVQIAAFTAGPATLDDTMFGQRLYLQAADGARGDPFNWAVHVYKSRHRIEISYKNQLFKTYHGVFGRSGLSGGKEWEGDSRTPEGAYLIIAKHPSARFRWFLKLNYPNATDEARFAELRANHQIPRGSHEGSLVGIHGTDSPMLNVEDVNWTLGCISVTNTDIMEMASLLPIGTLVVIKP
jgi:lipoprotein-anchoring transpeptidase ErfK/SrfK